MGDEEREAAAVVADPGLVDFLGGPRTAKNEEGVNIEDEREAESPSPNNREAKWRRGFEELEAENLAFRKAMLKLEDQLRLEKYNLEREKLEKMELRNKLIDFELNLPENDAQGDDGESDGSGDAPAPFLSPPAPRIHSKTKDELAKQDESRNDDTESLHSNVSESSASASGSFEPQGYEPSEAGASRFTDGNSTLDDFDRSLKDLNANFPRIPRTSSRARSSDLAARFQREADLTDERNQLRKQLDACSHDLRQAKLKEKQAVRKVKILLSRLKKERSRRLATKKSLKAEQRKSGSLSGHIEKVMVALRLEANGKQKQKLKERALQKSLDTEKERGALLREKCTIADQAIIQLKEQAEMLAGQLQLADDRYNDLRSRLEVERSSKNSEAAFWKKVAMKYERKKAKAASAPETSMPDASPMRKGASSTRRKIKRRKAKGKRRKHSAFPTVPTLFPKRSVPEETEPAMHLDYSTNIFPELKDVMGTDVSLMYSPEVSRRPHEDDVDIDNITGMKFSLGDISVKETAL